MSERQKIRILGTCFIALGVVLYFIVNMPIFATIMVFGGVVTFIIADKAAGDGSDDSYIDEDFRYGR